MYYLNKISKIASDLHPERNSKKTDVVSLAVLLVER